MQAPPEQLGSFYLGAEYDLQSSARQAAAVNYDARDLVTHAVCVGMTGSGKTGLCIGLLEEAAIDRVPAILIDPKGDITNLLLQFPDLQPSDFQPWINEDDARRKDKSPEEYAATVADQWKNGLADWGITGERMKLLAEQTSYTIFTPGSDMGIPINILGSLEAPDLKWDEEGEAIRERISGTVAALLGLAGSNADPVRSREGVLLSNIFEYYWQKGENLDLGKLIAAIQKPPMAQLGVVAVDTFYPEKERFGLAMAFNSLVASPKFQSWLQGEPLDVSRLYYDEQGKPRHSVIYIAHLSDTERMFIVTLLLENLITWMRRQSGTTSLRALLYFDEVFGYFPPTAEPPSKRPLLTLLKQARAFGLGCVLVTQNPVDLDYKGLTNAGTWFIGKLQAERDKDRLMTGLQGAMADAGQQAPDYGKIIPQLGNRVFLMHNVNNKEPIVFTTRWAMSYLRGPLTLQQVRTLMADRKAKMKGAPAQPAQAAAAAGASAPAAPAAGVAPAAVLAAEAAPAIAATLRGESTPAGLLAQPPMLDAAVTPLYLPVVVEEREALRIVTDQAGGQATIKGVQLVYQPYALGIASVRYADPKRKVDQLVGSVRLAHPDDSPAGIDWKLAEVVEVDPRKLLKGPEQAGSGPFFAPVPEAIAAAKKLAPLQKSLGDWLYYNDSLTINTQPDLGLAQDPDEDERDFRIRMSQVARERRDAEVDKLTKQYEKQLATLNDKLQRAQQSLADAQAKAQAKETEKWVNIGESVLGMFTGRSTRRAVSSATSKWNQAGAAAQNVEQTKENIASLSAELEKVKGDLEAQTQEITARWEAALENLQQESLKPKRMDVNVQTVTLGWAPTWQVVSADGVQTETIPAYKPPAGA